MIESFSLASLGWQPFFQQQLSLEEWDRVTPARVVEQHKSNIDIISKLGRQTLAITSSTPSLTVGDWVLLEEDGRLLRVMERQSCFRRRAVGRDAAEQLIAANVDTAFILCSLNDDFSLNRIERYLSVVNDAGAEPVVVLSKMDLCAYPESLRDQVQKLDPQLCVEMLNCKDIESASVLKHWCLPGKTVAMLGSSGAGKSTLTNALLGEDRQATGEIREEDAKGRHTTTHRSLLFMPNGALLMDTPGMRELQLSDCETGVSVTFAEVEELTLQCRFSNCEHETEPGCAIQKALKSGDLDERRFANYRKLLREQAFNSASLAERRASDRGLSKYHKKVQEAKYKKER